MSIYLNKIDKDFAFKLYKNSNAIICKIQIYIVLLNITCFEYGAAAIIK